MAVKGVESLVFGVEDLDAATRFCREFGLTESPRADAHEFLALDGCSVIILPADQPDLPTTTIQGSTCREVVWGVGSPEDLDAISADLSTDRDCVVDADGVLHSRDDDGRGIAFRTSRLQAYDVEPALANVSGLPPQRPINTRRDASAPVRPRTIGHVVYFSADPMRSFAFYRDRLGFMLTDYGADNGGAFARAPGSSDHHNIYFIGAPVFAPKMHHVEFHVTDFEEVMRGGQRLASAGWETEMGPGRHVVGGNVFWYFKTPCGVSFEYGADIDAVDDNWTPREWMREEPRNYWRVKDLM